MKRDIGFTLVAAAVGVVALVGSARADITKCQQGIEKNGDKLRASVWKALAKCKDGYQAAVAKGTPLADKAGPGCEEGLAKVINATDPASVMGKTKGCSRPSHRLPVAIGTS